MTTTLRYEFGKIDDIEQQFTLFNKVFDQEANEQSWKRKHYDNPLHNGKYYLMCAYDGDKLVGINGFGLINYNYNGMKFRAVESCDTAVDPDYRGRGVFIHMIEKAEAIFKEMGFDFIVGFPNDNSYYGFMKLGWIEMARTKKMLFICDAHKAFLKITGRYIPKFLNIISKAWLNVHGFVFRNNFSVEERMIESKDDYYNLAGNKDIHIDMSDDFFTWKLSSGHKLLEIKKNDTSIIKILICSYRENSSFKRGNVLIIHRETTDYKLLWKALNFALREIEKNYDMINVWESGDELIDKALKRAGFFSDFRHKNGDAFIVKILTNNPQKIKILTNKQNWSPKFIETDYVLDDYI